MLTRPTAKLILWTLALLFSTLACRTVTSLVLPDTPTAPPLPATVTPLPPPTSTPIPIEAAQENFCPVLRSDILEAATTPGSEKTADEERYLVTYKVTGNRISDPAYETIPASFKDEQEDKVTQKEIWDYFTALIPQEERRILAEYSIITDGKDNVLAAVIQTYDDPALWALEVDIADSSDYYNLTFTLIHEFGHLLTLNADQVPPSMDVFNNPDDTELYNQEVSLCPNYFPGEGCSESDSYINQFFHRFWTDIYAEWSGIDQLDDEEIYYEKLSEFYAHHQDQFVSDYAATNPGEDIAESWSHFVLGPVPQGNTIAEAKVLFFYEYPELVTLRGKLLSNLCAAFPQ